MWLFCKYLTKNKVLKTYNKWEGWKNVIKKLLFIVYSEILYIKVTAIKNVDAPTLGAYWFQD